MPSGRVRAEFLSLCDVAELALRAVEAAGLVSDDRPELALALVRRWCDGEVDDEALDATAEEATSAWSSAFEVPPLAAAYSAIDWLCLGAQDELTVVDDELRSRVLGNARDALIALGEPPEAAQRRVSEVMKARLAAHFPYWSER